MKRILVVEDEARIAHIVRDYLERTGHVVAIAGNGSEALTFARSQRPDLIVLDLGLPRMDGLEVTRALRKQSNVPIIMLTGLEILLFMLPLGQELQLVGQRLGGIGPSALGVAASLLRVPEQKYSRDGARSYAYVRLQEQEAVWMARGLVGMRAEFQHHGFARAERLRPH